MILVWIYLSLFFLLQVLALCALFIRVTKAREPQLWPKVSIWVAARNEEENILRCLKSLEALDYPEGQLEVWIGNDQSEDRTAERVREFIEGKPRFHLLDIQTQMGKAEKKANVLAHLAHASSGDYFLVCDADIRVKPSWAKALVSDLVQGTGVVSGTTLIEGNRFFASMQRYDWLYFMGLLQSAARLGIPCTAVGNNMGFSREAYFATGGYEAIDFSITEDFKLFTEILKRGYAWKNRCDAESVSFSAPVPNLPVLLSQRKRWLEGGRELPVYWKLTLLLYGLFNPLMILLLFLHWKIALVALVARMLLQSANLVRVHSLIGEKPSVRDIVLYDGYGIVITLLSSLNFLLPGNKEWKARKYT